MVNMGIKKRVARSSSLPLLALRGLVVFPGMLLHFDVGRQKSIQALNASMGADQIIYLVTQRDVAQDDPSVAGLYTVGVVAKVRQVLKLPGDNLRILVEGLYRAGVEEVLQTEPFLMVAVRERLERRIAGSLRAQAVMRECRTYFEEYAQLAPKLAPDVSLGVAAAQDAGYLADYIAASGGKTGYLEHRAGGKADGTAAVAPGTGMLDPGVGAGYSRTRP